MITFFKLAILFVVVLWAALATYFQGKEKGYEEGWRDAGEKFFPLLQGLVDEMNKNKEKK